MAWTALDGPIDLLAGRGPQVPRWIQRSDFNGPSDLDLRPGVSGPAIEALAAAGRETQHLSLAYGFGVTINTMGYGRSASAGCILAPDQCADCSDGGRRRAQFQRRCSILGECAHLGGDVDLDILLEARRPDDLGGIRS